MRRAVALVPVAVLVIAGIPRTAEAWNPLKSAGNSLASGAAESLQPVLAGTIDHAAVAGHSLVADVDARVGKNVDKIQQAATVLLGQANQDLAGRVDQIDDRLDKRIRQIQRTASGAIADLDGRVKEDLQTVDHILDARVQQIDGVVKGALNQADAILEQRIDQIDETVGRRLGNVDVIATKQRLAIEQTLLRVAVMIGLVIFVVIVLVRLWRLYGRISDELVKEPRPAEHHTRSRRRYVATRLAGSAVLQLGAAAVAAGVLFVLYHELPLGAAKQAEELVAQHEQGLKESLDTFDFTRVQFHASQLELLTPEKQRHDRAMAAKGDLMRDIFLRPTILGTPEGVSSIVNRVGAVEQLLGDEPDPDLLVVKATVLWEVGQSRADEREAASLCTRALRVRPSGFALAPLARDQIETFLASPLFDEETPLGRESESASNMQAVINNVIMERGAFPLAAKIEFDRLVRRLERTSSNAYYEMLVAQAELTRLRAAPATTPTALQEARTVRNGRARAVVEAWDKFDAKIEDVPGLAGSPLVLAVFRLDDVPYIRAKWFLVHPDASDPAPALLLLKASERALYTPPRLGWDARYGSLLGQTRLLVESREARRWNYLEKQTLDFEAAFANLQRATSGGRLPGDLDDLRRLAALPAANLGLFVDRPQPVTAGAPPAATALERSREPSGDPDRIDVASLLLGNTLPTLLRAAIHQGKDGVVIVDQPRHDQLVAIAAARLHRNPEFVELPPPPAQDQPPPSPKKRHK